MAKWHRSWLGRLLLLGVVAVGLYIYFKSPKADIETLATAVRHRDTELAVWVMKKYPEWREHQFSGIILDDAMRHGDKNMVRALVEGGYDLDRVIIRNRDSSDSRGGELIYPSPLASAARMRDDEMVLHLLELGANPNGHPQERTTPLEIACEFPYGATTPLIRIQDLRTEAELEAYIERWVNGTASRKLVQALLEAGANPNLGGHRRPLESAVSDGRPDLVELLLKHGADPNTLTWGTTPLLESYALNSGFKEYHDEHRSELKIVPDYPRVRELLLQYGAVEPDLESYDRLIKAFNSEDAKALSSLLDSEPGMAELFLYGRLTLAEMAAYKGRLDVLQDLLKRGVELNKPDPTGHTALCSACAGGNLETVQFLIDNGADVNLGCRRACPLGNAARMRHREIVELLLSHGADPNGRGDGDTPLQLACKLQTSGGSSKVLPPDISIVRVLLNAGADPNKAGKYTYYTPMSAALERDDRDLARLLGASQYWPNSN
ncbi:MAG: ankyrin repeat domain-containing protein [Planctomycetaceae bacterium]